MVLPLSRAAVFAGYLAVAVILQLLSGALAVPRSSQQAPALPTMGIRQLDDGADYASETGGAGAGQTGEEEMAGVYASGETNSVGDSTTDAKSTSPPCFGVHTSAAFAAALSTCCTVASRYSLAIRT